MKNVLPIEKKKPRQEVLLDEGQYQGHLSRTALVEPYNVLYEKEGKVCCSRLVAFLKHEYQQEESVENRVNYFLVCLSLVNSYTNNSTRLYFLNCYINTAQAVLIVHTVTQHLIYS